MHEIAANIRHAEPLPDERQVGLCECGCRQPTNLAPRNRADRGWMVGEPVRFRRGHHGRKRIRYVEASAGYKTPCWIWQLAKDTNGYGAAWISSGMAPAHRAIYEERHGPVPDGTELDHLCRVRACVNPDHLEPVSHAENCRRGARAKLTADQVAAIRASSETQRVIARQFGISQGHVSRVRNERTWRTDDKLAPDVVVIHLKHAD